MYDVCSRLIQRSWVKRLRVSISRLDAPGGGHDINVHLLCNHFETAHRLLMKTGESYSFWVTGSKVKVYRGPLSLKLCGYDTDNRLYRLCQITFKLHTYVVKDQGRKHIDFWSWDLRPRSTLIPSLWNILGPMQTSFYGPAWEVCGASSACNWIVRPPVCLLVRLSFLVRLSVRFSVLPSCLNILSKKRKYPHL